MKKLFLSFFSALICVIAGAENLTLAHANQLCQDGEYDKAVQAYELLLGQGLESASLYYNLGYSYYKQGEIGKAALNFERSKRLNPSDADVEFNLEQIYASTDKMEVIQPIFFEKWIASFRNITNSDGWAWVFIVLFALILVGVGLFLFAERVVLRKVGFFSAIVCALFAIISFSISLSKRSEILDSRAAIIMSPSVTLCASPDKNAVDMAVLHEGTYIDILSELGDWCEVRLKDGNVGWLKASDIEKI